MTTATYFDAGEGIRLACHHHSHSTPGVMFLGGFKSDMTGSKATTLEQHCLAQGISFTRFDYQGHGQSSGEFREGSIGQWAGDALAILDNITDGPQILVGSSMGGWIMLLLALARPHRVAGLIGIAAAPDFTHYLIWERLTAAQRAEMERQGVLYVPSDYGDAYPITLQLIEESRQHLLLDADIAIDCPVRLIHGMLDPDVPWELAPKLAQQLTSHDVQLMLVKEGDHRMSDPENLALILRTLDTLRAEILAQS